LQLAASTQTARRRHFQPALALPRGRWTRSGVGPRDRDLAGVRVQPERPPHGGRRVHDVAAAPAAGVALVHDAGLHGAPGAPARDADRPVAPVPAREPPRGQRHDELAVAVEVPVARRRAAAALAALEPVHRHHRGGAAVARRRRQRAGPPGRGARDLKQSKDRQEHENFSARHCRNSALGGERA
jgi:hypothetical protein